MNKWMLRLGLGVVVLIIAAALGFKSYTSSQSDAIYEAVVRDVAANSGDSLSPAGNHIFFLQINGRDASPAFIQKFQGAGFSVRPGTDGANVASLYSGNATKDVATGESGAVLKLGPISWGSLSKPMVPLGGYTFEMNHDAAYWRVANRYMSVAGF